MDSNLRAVAAQIALDLVKQSIELQSLERNININPFEAWREFYYKVLDELLSPEPKWQRTPTPDGSQ